MNQVLSCDSPLKPPFNNIMGNFLQIRTITV